MVLCFRVNQLILHYFLIFMMQNRKLLEALDRLSLELRDLTTDETTSNHFSTTATHHDHLTITPTLNYKINVRL